MPAMALSRRTLVISIAAIVLLIATGLFFKSRSDSTGTDPATAVVTSTEAAATLGTDNAFAGDGPPPVHGAMVVRDTLVISVNAQGQAAASRQIPLSMEVGGRIASLPYRENDAVVAGAALVGLDTTEFAFNLASAET